MGLITTILQKIFGKLDDAEKAVSTAVQDDSHNEIDDVIAHLAGILADGNSELFEEEAHDKIGCITVSDLPYLQKKFHNCPPIPSSVDKSKFGLGTWMALCQHASFELIYNLGITAKDFVREIAFGPYDWTQANALTTLCRWYIDDKLGKDTIDEINKKLPDMRYEAHLYFAQDLLRFQKYDARFTTVINELNDKDFNEAMLEIIEAQSKKAPP